MNIAKYISRNDQGSVLVIALVILVLITLMGISVTTTSDIDVQIAKNEREYVQEFYAADSAWREAVQWLDTRAAKPGLVNRSLFVTGNQDSDVYKENALNVRNFGNGESGAYNDTFAANPDGTVGEGAGAVRYWYKIAYLKPAGMTSDEDAMAGRNVAGFGEGFRQYSFVITSVANGTQRVDVTVTKVLPTGE